MVLTEELEKLGLSNSESRAYIALTSIKEGRASEIARVSRIPRNKIYAVLESLHMKGFAEILPEKVMRFRAVPFDSAFLLFLESSERHVDELKKTGEKVVNQLKHVRYDRHEVGEFTVYKSKKIIYKKLIELIQSAHESIALCLEMPEMRRVYFLFKNSGKKLDVEIITKIETGTRSEAKEWMGFANLRHAENIPPAKIAVIDGKEVFVFQPDAPIALHSTDKSFVSLIQNFTTILWNSSLPAKERIAWLETGKPAEDVKFVKGEKAVYEVTKELSLGAKKMICNISTEGSPERTLRFGVFSADEDLAKKGVRFRCIYPITKKNVRFVKKIMGIADVRHIDFSPMRVRIIDGRMCIVRQLEEEELNEKFCIYSNAKDFISAIQLFFDKTWSQAVPAEARIRQLEGITNAEVENVKVIKQYRDKSLETVS